MELFYKLHKHKDVSLAPRTTPIFDSSDSVHSKHILTHFCFLGLMLTQIENNTRVRKPRAYLCAWIHQHFCNPQNLSTDWSLLFWKLYVNTCSCKTFNILTSQQSKPSTFPNIPTSQCSEHPTCRGGTVTMRGKFSAYVQYSQVWLPLQIWGWSFSAILNCSTEDEAFLQY